MKQLSTYTDAVLVQLYKIETDPQLIGELYKRYSLLVFGLCYKYLKTEEDSKDAVVEIFEVVMDKLKSHEVTFFSSWLYKVSKNYLVRQKNRNKNTETLNLENIPEKFMESGHDLTLNVREHESVLLNKAISSLNDDQRTCIELFYLRQKPYQEVASMTGYDLNKVKTCIQNGRRNLKIFMEGKNTFYE
ncbi:MAG: sigma-70 family polymerase sigma factor [Bacteroidota bacterium]|nr:sigma-70 family polymerase sigma factor [Bacteroidota bacterium]